VDRREQIAMNDQGYAWRLARLSCAVGRSPQGGKRVAAAVGMHDPKLHQSPNRRDHQSRNGYWFSNRVSHLESIETVDYFRQPAAAALGEAQAMKSHGALLQCIEARIQE
jgi:hypothetical protein